MLLFLCIPGCDFRRDSFTVSSGVLLSDPCSISPEICNPSGKLLMEPGGATTTSTTEDAARDSVHKDFLLSVELGSFKLERLLLLSSCLLSLIHVFTISSLFCPLRGIRGLISSYILEMYELTSVLIAVIFSTSEGLKPLKSLISTVFLLRAFILSRFSLVQLCAIFLLRKDILMFLLLVPLLKDITRNERIRSMKKKYFRFAILKIEIPNSASSVIKSVKVLSDIF
ncbi:unnamed protein product [Moneuplotes crassus]|uniref:Uncharacterized protein n=1 Tax=Euplotes crassus TaxID=5936 RepID=A0AAD1XV84_EUPCR|nr:unnamed protein product [Moneuplotes crassus]